MDAVVCSMYFFLACMLRLMWAIHRFRPYESVEEKREAEGGIGTAYIGMWGDS